MYMRTKGANDVELLSRLISDKNPCIEEDQLRLPTKCKKQSENAHPSKDVFDFLFLGISPFVFLSVRAFLIDRFPLPFSLFVIIMWVNQSCLQ